MNIKIIRSEKRKCTISPSFRGEGLFIYLPSGLSVNKEKKCIEKITKSVERKKLKRWLDNNSIEYVTNQNLTRFGSCTSNKGTIRISHRAAQMPTWVLDYLVIHELAHFVHPNHSTIAKGMGA